MGIPIILIITIMGITLTATFRSIMISMIFIISIMTATLIVTSVVGASVVILRTVTTVGVMAGEATLDCLRRLSVGIFEGDLTEILLDF